MTTDDAVWLGLLICADEWVDGTLTSIRAARDDGAYETAEQVARRVLRAMPDLPEVHEPMALLLATALLRLVEPEPNNFP